MRALRVLLHSHCQRTDYIWQHPELLRAAGVELVNTSPDFCYLDWNQYTTDLVESLPAPVVLEDTADAAMLTRQRRQAAKHPKVVAVFRQIVFRDRSAQNGPNFGNDLCSGISAETCGERVEWTRLTTLTEKELAKIRLVYPLGCLRKTYPAPLRPLLERQYDLHCVLCMTYSGHVPERYRAWYMKRVERLAVSSFLYRASRNTVPDLLPHDVYFRTMGDSPARTSAWHARFTCLVSDVFRSFPCSADRTTERLGETDECRKGSDYRGWISRLQPLLVPPQSAGRAGLELHSPQRPGCP